MLGKFTGQQETHGGLDLSGGDRGPLVVVSQSGGLGSDSLKDVVDEAVHDGHGLAGHTGVGVHLLQNFVDVDRVALPPPALPLLVGRPRGLRLGRGFLRALGRNTTFRRHSCICNEIMKKSTPSRVYLC